MPEGDESRTQHQPSIPTDFEIVRQGLDNGVDYEIHAEEEFVHYGGEHIERETQIALLEDGGVHITQGDNQGVVSTLTLGEKVVNRLVKEVQNR